MVIIGEYFAFLIGGDWVFSSYTDSLGCQPFKGASWALVLGLPLRDTIKDLLLVLGPFLIPFWACVLGLRTYYFKPHHNQFEFFFLFFFYFGGIRLMLRKLTISKFSNIPRKL